MKTLALAAMLPMMWLFWVWLLLAQPREMPLTVPEKKALALGAIGPTLATALFLWGVLALFGVTP